MELRDNSMELRDHSMELRGNSMELTPSQKLNSMELSPPPSIITMCHHRCHCQHHAPAWHLAMAIYGAQGVLSKFFPTRIALIGTNLCYTAGGMPQLLGELQ